MMRIGQIKVANSLIAQWLGVEAVTSSRPSDNEAQVTTFTIVDYRCDDVVDGEEIPSYDLTITETIRKTDLTRYD